MTSFNTGNPVPSADARDLYDNARNLDAAVNDQSAETWTDRLGEARKTWHGMEQDFQEFLLESGLQILDVEYGPGIEITARNQIIRADGEFWRLSASEDLPYTTDGTGMPEDGAFVAVGDAVLRGELADLMPHVGFYGGNPTLSDNMTAFLAMGGDVGYIRVPRGEYMLSSGTIDYPIYFDPGASITVGAGDSVAIRNRVEAGRQWIFRGDGDYFLNVQAGGSLGEDARVLRAEWFGVFPTNTTVVDQSERLQKALNSLSAQTREGVVEVGHGSFHMLAGVTLPRGVWLRGEGIRRTVFYVTGDGFTVFATDANASRISDLQFEYPAGTTDVRASPFIELNHRDCEARQIRLWSAERGIVINGPSCVAEDIEAAYALDVPANSSAVLVNASGARVKNVRQVTSPRGPSAMVEIGRGATSNFGSVTVSGIHWYGPSVGVRLTANGANLSGINIDEMNFAGTSGITSPALWELVAEGSSNISEVTISGQVGNSLAEYLGKIRQLGTGILERVIVDNAVLGGSSGNGILFERQSGTLRGVIIADDVQVRNRDVPFEYIGVTSGVQVSPSATPDASPAYCYSYTIADDSVVVIPVRRSIFGCSAIVTGASNVSAVLFIRAASSPNVAIIGGTATNVTAQSGALSGTTGPDGSLNVSADSENIYLENRRGSSQAVNLALLAGAQF